MTGRSVIRRKMEPAQTKQFPVSPVLPTTCLLACPLFARPRVCDIFQYRPRTEVNETRASLVQRMTCPLIWQKRCNCSHTRILERTKYHRINARFFSSESFFIQHCTLLCDGHCYCVVTQLGILFTLCLEPVLRVSTST